MNYELLGVTGLDYIIIWYSADNWMIGAVTATYCCLPLLSSLENNLPTTCMLSAAVYRRMLLSILPHNIMMASVREPRERGHAGDRRCMSEDS